jgi:hypothetical protein
MINVNMIANLYQKNKKQDQEIEKKNHEINIASLHETTKRREELKLKTFQKVLELCHNKIKLVAQTNSLICWFAVPEIVTGFPLYDIEECSEWLLDKLLGENLKVDYFKPGLFLISWKVTSESDKYVQNEYDKDSDQYKY